jgi:hypothetical protein
MMMLKPIPAGRMERNDQHAGLQVATASEGSRALWPSALSSAAPATNTPSADRISEIARGSTNYPEARRPEYDRTDSPLRSLHSNPVRSEQHDEMSPEKQTDPLSASDLSAQEPKAVSSDFHGNDTSGTDITSPTATLFEPSTSPKALVTGIDAPQTRLELLTNSTPPNSVANDEKSAVVETVQHAAPSSITVQPDALTEASMKEVLEPSGAVPNSIDAVISEETGPAESAPPDVRPQHVGSFGDGRNALCTVRDEIQKAFEEGLDNAQESAYNAHGIRFRVEFRPCKLTSGQKAVTVLVFPNFKKKLQRLRLYPKFRTLLGKAFDHDHFENQLKSLVSIKDQPSSVPKLTDVRVTLHA